MTSADIAAIQYAIWNHPQAILFLARIVAILNLVGKPVVFRSGGGQGYYWVGDVRVPIGDPNPFEVAREQDEEMILMTILAAIYG
jgi:hypothetical protein